MFLRSLITAAFAMGLTVPALAAQAPPPSTQAARQAAEALIEKFDAAYNRHDAAAIAALYAEDAVFVPSQPSPSLGAVITGRPQIERFFADAFRVFGTQHERLVDVGGIADGDNALWMVTELHLSGSGVNGPARLDGHVGAVLVRRGDAWQLRMTTASARVPQNPSTAERPSR